MRAWATFDDTDYVAVIGLFRDIPQPPATPSVAPPWQAALLKLDVPPPGWQVP
jgi:hypothetical protein